MKKYILCGLISALFTYSLCNATTPAVALQKDTALWNQKSAGMMEWAKLDLEPGTEVELYENSELESSWTSAKDGQTLTFAKVKYQKKDYYVIANRIAPDKKAAVVVQEAATYLSRNLADVRKTSLPVGTVIAIGKSSENLQGNFFEVSYYDQSAYRIRNGYVRATKISDKRDDIDALKILAQAKSATDANMQTALFQSLKHLKTSTAVQELIEAAQEELNKPDISESEIMDFAQASACQIYAPNSDNIRLRSVPGTKGDVLASLEAGTEGRTLRRTVETETIDGTEDSWFFCEFTAGTETVSGWVFGAYLLIDGR